MPLARSLVWFGAVSLIATTAGAQGRGAAAEPRTVPRWEPPGFDFSPNGVWRVRARAVARARAALLSRRQFAQLNAPLAGAAGPGAPALAGVLQVPVVLFSYKDTPLADLRDTAVYRSLLFSTSPPLGRPYTYRTFYEQLSTGLFSVQGNVYGYSALSKNEVSYTGGTSSTCQTNNPYGTTNCNGIWSSAATDSMQAGMREALGQLDGSINFSQYDADGDGIVDLVVFLHPAVDGACNTTHLWAHRFFLLSPFITNDPAPGGGTEIVRDYIVQSGVGGATTCNGTQYMSVGTVAHETGHGLGLPDLYDTRSSSEGIGHWGLMSSGNQTTSDSPSRMEAWSLSQLGWVTLAPITAGGTYSFGAAPVSDTAFIVGVNGANPRGEYFLVENRQGVQSDSALIRIHGPGLMVWHVDSQQIAQGFPANRVNSGPIHGLALEEADGLNNLLLGDNRGDAGDPYPGTSANTALSFNTTPAAIKDLDSSFAGFAIDSIRQIVPNGEMAFRLRFGGLTVVQASDTTVPVLVDGLSHNVFRDLFEDGSSHTIAVADSQPATSGRTLSIFQSWSDGLAISHTVTGAFAGATYTATLRRAHRLDVTVGANGTVAYNPPADTSGTFIDQGTPVTLTATPTAPLVFGGWTGDTTAASPTLVLPMGRPFAVSAHFDPQLAITSGEPRPGGIMGKAYADTLRASGGSGTYSWQKASGSLPTGLTLDVSGRITGFPAQTGVFTFTARVTSVGQQQQQPYSITVAAPTLVAANVVNQLLNAAGTLTIDDIRYLDLLGNKSCVVVTQNCFDVGDFLAWVQATGVTPAPPIAAAARKGGRP